MKTLKTKNLFGEWFEKGNHDLENAKILFKNDGYTDTICFLCQQAAEKYLKGYLVFYKIEPPKIHSLAALTQICAKSNGNFIKFAAEIKHLDKYYIEARYPLGMPILFSAKETKTAIQLAEKIIDFIAGEMAKTKK